jgi:hypothetical protein
LVRADQPATSMWTIWTNSTCEPPSAGGFPGGGFPGGGGGGGSGPAQGTCTLGWMPHYVIMAKTAAHIQAGVKFAKEKNIRLIIRNTGHDFMGRSTGYGSLAINTHSFKTMEWIKNYTGPSEDKWTGGAVKLGVGIQTRDLYTAAFNQSPKVVVVGGECAVRRIARYAGHESYYDGDRRNHRGLRARRWSRSYGFATRYGCR